MAGENNSSIFHKFIAKCFFLLKFRLTDNQESILSEDVFRDFEVEWSRTFPDSAGCVVVRAVARAVVATEVARVSDWDATL